MIRTAASPDAAAVMERTDRLARDLLVSEVILGQFRDLNVRVIAADSGTGTAPTGRPPTVRLPSPPSPQSPVDGLTLGDA